MADVLKNISAFIWHDSFWFPPGKGWKDLEITDDGIYKPQFSDLLVPIPVALVLLFVRYIFEKYCASPFGKHYGLKEGKVMVAEPNSILEKSYKKHRKHPDSKVIEGLSKQTDLSIRQVERWYRKRRNQDRASALKKFNESAWRCLYYLSVFIYGVWCLHDKPWVTDTVHCWLGWPDKQHVSNDLYWYYMIELGFYLSLLFSLMTDVKRKDFWEMVAHHFITIGLMTLSWINNFVRVGTLVLVVHDAVDYWLEGAKMANYLKKTQLCNILFAVFIVVWFITRLCLYPLWICYKAGFVGRRAILGTAVMIDFLNLSGVALQVLHLVWTKMILKFAYQSITNSDKVNRDVRSETEEAVTTEEEPEKLDTNANTDDHLPLRNGTVNCKTNGVIN